MLPAMTQGPDGCTSTISMPFGPSMGPAKGWMDMSCKHCFQHHDASALMSLLALIVVWQTYRAFWIRYSFTQRKR